MSVVIVADIQIGRLEQFQVREAPHLVRDTAEDIVHVHGGVCGHDSVDFGKNGEAVWS
jgi:hypothetical protein